MNVRLAKFIANSGFASRRTAEQLISDGHVFVDGVKITDVVFFVSGAEDIQIKGKKISDKNETVLYAFHKPINTITSNFDPSGRRTIFDCLKDEYKNLKYVGRLDYKTTGLLLLTNDGELSRKLTLPSSEIKRTYIARTSGKDFSGLEILRRGTTVDGIKYRPMEIKVLENNDLQITIVEGKKREIRITLASVNLPVIKLHRISYGNIKLGDLKPGEIKLLSQKTIDAAFKKN